MLSRKLWSGLGTAAIASLALLSAVAQEASQPATRPAVYPPNLASSLIAAGQRLSIKDVLEVRPFFDWPLIGWSVHIDERATERLPNQYIFASATDPATRWYQWYRSMNEELLRITRNEAQRSQEELYVETDVSVDFGHSLAERAWAGMCKFRGSRCTYLRDTPPGLDLSASPAADERAQAVRVTVTIRPDKPTWKARETITGTVIWENTGKQRVAMQPYGVNVRREDGTAPPEIPPKTYICGTSKMSGPLAVLRPGERQESHFSIETDPLYLDGGLRLDDGCYDLYVLDMKDWLNIPIECQPARIEVRTRPDQDLSPRIIYFGVGGARLVIVRENGDFEAYDIDSAQQVARGHVADCAPMSNWESDLRVSPDGQWLALLRRPYRGPAPSDIELFRLNGNDVQVRKLAVPTEIEHNTPELLRFSPDGKLLLLTSRDEIWALDATIGVRTWRTTRAAGEALTLDGRQRVRLTDQGIELVPRDSACTSAPAEPPDAESLRIAWAGRDGVYLARGRLHIDSFRSFDGQRRVTFGENVAFLLAESPDASVVALLEHEEETLLFEGPIAFWRLDPPEPLWRLAGKKRREIAFTAPPVRVVCGIQNDSSFGTDVYSPAFEVYDPNSGRLLKTLDLAYRHP